MTILQHVQKQLQKKQRLEAAQKQLCYRGVKYTKA